MATKKSLKVNDSEMDENKKQLFDDMKSTPICYSTDIDLLLKQYTTASKSYSAKKADQIIFLTAQGVSMGNICAHSSFPPQSVVRWWITENIEKFGDRYNEAKRTVCEKYLEEIVPIADNTDDITHAKLTIDARKYVIDYTLEKLDNESVKAESTQIIDMAKILEMQIDASINSSS